MHVYDRTYPEGDNLTPAIFQSLIDNAGFPRLWTLSVEVKGLELYVQASFNVTGDTAKGTSCTVNSNAPRIRELLLSAFGETDECFEDLLLSLFQEHAELRISALVFDTDETNAVSVFSNSYVVTRKVERIFIQHYQHRSCPSPVGLFVQKDQVNHIPYLAGGPTKEGQTCHQLLTV